jgi:hypothetical protein
MGGGGFRSGMGGGGFRGGMGGGGFRGGMGGGFRGGGFRGGAWGFRGGNWGGNRFFFGFGGPGWWGWGYPYDYGYYPYGSYYPYSAAPYPDYGPGYAYSQPQVSCPQANGAPVYQIKLTYSNEIWLTTNYWYTAGTLNFMTMQGEVKKTPINSIDPITLQLNQACGLNFQGPG